MEYILSPSILSADFCRLGEQIDAVQEAGAKYLHFDVMDGLFVQTISYGTPVLRSIRKHTDLLMDVHLMVVEPERYVEAFAHSGADIITFHLEATSDVEETIALIRANGKKVGIAIKPGTESEAVYPFLPMVDMVLVMTVEPGYGGQKLIPECLDKVTEIRDKATELGVHVDIQVDGGLNSENVSAAIFAGANVIVAGSAVFNDNPQESVHAFLKHMNG